MEGGLLEFQDSSRWLFVIFLVDGVFWEIMKV